MSKTFSQVVRDWFLEPIITKINEMEKRIMSQIDDLKAAYAEEKATLLQVVTANADAFKRLEDMIAALGASSPEIQAVTDGIKANTQTLKDLLAKDQAEGAPTPPAA